MTQDSMIGGRNGREIMFRAIWHTINNMNTLRHAQCYVGFNLLLEAQKLLLRAIDTPIPPKMIRASTAPELLATLKDCEQFLDERADCDMDGDRYRPNPEMQLLQIVRAAIAKTEGGAA